MKTDKLAAILLIPCLVGYVAYDQFTKARDQNAATAAGFSDLSEFRAATAAGIPEPGAWAAERQRLAAAKQKKDAEEYERTRNPSTKMNAKTLSWTKSGFGTVGLVTIAIENQNEFAVKDVLITCDFTASSGTKVGTASGTIYETIKPKSTRTFKEFNIGFIHSQSQRGGCAVDSARRL